MRLWIDTDLGTNVDDAVAVLAAVAHPAVELVGVSTVGSDPERRAAVAVGLLAAAGVDLGAVAVVAGEPGPRPAPTPGAAGVVEAVAASGAEALLAIGP
ncbi:MAG: Inosine-uridine preferring nucleoside hydrolase, partial [Actinomycetota bacterium]|nr:Inosine-uridine preferring nucleoside hydrolase [Actinomycetota bacterium]